MEEREYDSTNTSAQQGSLKRWKSVFDESIQSESTSDLENYLNVSYFSDIWGDIFGSPSHDTAISEGFQFLASYRHLVYAFKDSKSLSINHSDYTRLQIQSLVDCICKYPQYHQVLSIIIKTLSHELHSLLLDEISFENLPFVLDCVDSVWALKSLKILLKKSTKHSNLVAIVKNENSISMIKFYVHKALIEIDGIVVMDELALIHHGSELFATALVESFSHDEHYVDIFLDRVACLWGSKLFILQGNENMQIYLTTMILQLLHKIDDNSSRSRLMERCPRGNGMPLAITLSQGVSAYFDTTDTKSRNRAMTIAKLFSSKLGNEIKFSTDTNNESTPSSSTSSSSSSVINAMPVNSKVQATSEDKNKINESYDSDGDDDDNNSEFSDLEPYEIIDIDKQHPHNLAKSKSKFQTVYLRNCLEMLQYPDSKPDAYDKHFAALTNIPNIVASSPVDGFDLAGALTKELLRLQNAFNMENFSELQRTAIQSLLCEYPAQSVGVITQSILSDSLSLGSKIEALTQLVFAAHVLAGIDPHSTYETSKVKGTTGGGVGKEGSMRVLKSVDSMIHSDNASDDANTKVVEKSDDDSMIQSRTKIKRPTKLRQYHDSTSNNSRTRYFRNRFGTVSHLFFHPVLNLLTGYLRKIKNQSQSSISPLIQNVATIGDDKSSSSVDKPASSVSHKQKEAEVYDDVDSLLISQAILTLGAFVRCSINTPAQKPLAIETFKYAFICKDLPSLSIRRAAISAILSSVECFLLLSKSVSSVDYNNSSRQFSSGSALEVLCDVTSIDKDSTAMSVDPQVLSIISTVIDWVKATHHLDLDLNSQIIKREMMKMALQVLDI